MNWNTDFVMTTTPPAHIQFAYQLRLARGPWAIYIELQVRVCEAVAIHAVVHATLTLNLKRAGKPTALGIF